MKNNYLLEYTSNFLYQKKVKELITKNNFGNNYCSEYDLSENSLDLVLEDLDTYSFLSEKKVILLKGIELLDIENKKTRHLLNYLANSDSSKLLIMSSMNLDNRKKITKELKKETTYLKLENNPTSMIKEELKGYKINEDIVELLINYSNGNLDAIKTECDKLKQYKYQEKIISTEDIKNICYRHIGDSSELIFELVRQICSKDKRGALTTYQKLYEYNIDDLGMMGLLESQLRLLEQITILMNQNKRKQEISTILEIHPYRVEKTQELLQKITKKEIDELIFHLAEIDYKFKSGIYEGKKSLEVLLLNL